MRKIIEMISSTPMTPTMISQELGFDSVRTSRYLSVLKNGNLVKIRREQNNLFYSLNHNEYKKLVEATMNLAGDNFVNKFEESIGKKLKKQSQNPIFNKSEENAQ